LVSWLIIVVSVTAVGATEFTTDETEETASEFSGGGFSNFFKRPTYQDTTVAAYLKATNNTRNTAFNLSGRAGKFCHLLKAFRIHLYPYHSTGPVCHFLCRLDH
jgi:hypothetical protein